MTLEPSEFGPNRILPAGTKIVLRTPSGIGGNVGVIIGSPTDPYHSYRIRLVDGTERALSRAEFGVLKEVQVTGLKKPERTSTIEPLPQQIIYRCVIGSRAYGLAHDDSDTDIRGIFIPSANAHWSLFGVPDQLESDETQECYWELQKFLMLALKANPNVLECLYSPEVLHVAPLGSELLDMRSVFLSKLVYQTYNGYVLSQFKKLEQDMRTRGDIRWKHAMHLIRLLLSGIVALRDRFVPVRVEDHREQLLAIKQGVVAWETVNAWRLQLHAEFDSTYAATSLPDRPDYQRVNEFLVKARRSRVNHD
ncbi:MAG TPA: nucleotidyltransferase domain-containing protein [Phycisphaerae bacterium]|nr:nucleotidyltransferase domain-containing protein [Phycisphaerae bacterium]